MSAKIGQLLIDIHANVAKLSQDMNKAQSTLNGALGNMSKTLKAFGSAIAGAFAVDKVLTFVDNTIDAAVAIESTAQQIGTSAEALQEFRYAAATAGVAAEDMDQVLRDLGDRMGDAASGAQGWQEAFKALGVNIYDTAGRIRPLEEVFLDVADGMKNADSDATRLFRSMELFGDQGAKLLPVLIGGSEGVEKLRQEARELGAVMGGDTTAQAAKFSENMTKLQGALTVVSAHLLDEILPPLISLSERFIEGAKQGKGFATVIATGFKIVATVGEVVWQIFNHVGKSIGQLGAAIVELVQGNFRNAYQIVSEGGKEIRGDWMETFNAIGEMWSESEEPPAKATANTVQRVRKVAPVLASVAAEAKRMAEAIAASMQRTADIEAELSGDRLRQIRQSYAAEIAELEKKIADTKIKEAEKNAYLAELDAVKRKRDKELADAELEMALEHERRRRDAALETNALRASLTETAIDDIEASYAQQLEMLERNLQDKELTEEEYAERRKVLLALKDKEVSEAAKDEAEKRMEVQLGIYRSLAAGIGNAFGREFLNPMAEGFLKLESLLESLANLVMDIISQVITSGIANLILGGLTGGAGGVVGGLLGFSEGGLVRGPGGPTDDKVGPVMLSNDEYVIRAESAKKLGLPTLDWLNKFGELPAVKLPRFAAGGSVGGSRVSAGSVGGGVNVHLTQVVQAGGGLLHRELLARELGPTLRQLAIEQLDSVIRQLGLTPATVTARGG